MSRASFTLLVSVWFVAAGCAGEEDFGPVRDPGGHGGGGGSSTNGDARVTDAPDDGDGGAVDAPPDDTDGATDQLTGEICIVSDLRLPDACPAVAARADVTVRVTATGASALSGSDGRFTVSATGTVVLDVAEGIAGLVRSTVPATAGATLVHAPVVTASYWQQVQDAIGQVQPDDAGVVVLYVQDPGGPVIGATMDAIAGATVVPHYDDGGALAWASAGGTGVRGVALFLDVAPGTLTLSGNASGGRTVSVPGVPVVADAITFVRVTLASP